jgi:hypothetical protein
MILDCIGHSYNRLRGDRSLFELLPGGGQCNPWTRELFIQKYLLRPLARNAKNYDISEVKIIIDSARERIAGLHLCTARDNCPMLFCLRCLKADISQISVATEGYKNTENMTSTTS